MSASDPCALALLGRVPLAEVEASYARAYEAGRHGSPLPEEYRRLLRAHGEAWVLAQVPLAALDYQDESESGSDRRQRAAVYGAQLSTPPPGIAYYGARSQTRRTGKAYVWDGNHRVLAAQVAGACAVQMHLPESEYLALEKDVMTTKKRTRLDQMQRLDLGVRPSCNICGHSNWTYELRPGGWTCQRHREWWLEESELREKAMKPNGDLAWREAYAREYKDAEREGLDAPSARERASQRAWADYRSRTGQDDYLRNARRPKEKAHEQDFAGYKFTSGPAGTVIHRQRIQTESSGDYGADPVGDGTFRMVPSGDVVDFEERNRRLDRFRRNGGDLRDRVADALGWSAEQVRSMSWQSLRDLVRPVSQKLAQEITTAIQSGSYALPEHLRPPEQRPNRTGYYVWVIDPVRNWPLDEGPYGPHDLVTAKQLARIGATKGQFDRAVSTSPDPQSRSFEIVRRYEAQTGRRIV